MDSQAAQELSGLSIHGGSVGGSVTGDAQRPDSAASGGGGGASLPLTADPSQRLPSHSSSRHSAVGLPGEPSNSDRPVTFPPAQSSSSGLTTWPGDLMAAVASGFLPPGPSASRGASPHSTATSSRPASGLDQQALQPPQPPRFTTNVNTDLDLPLLDEGVGTAQDPAVQGSPWGTTMYEDAQRPTTSSSQGRPMGSVGSGTPIGGTPRGGTGASGMGTPGGGTAASGTHKSYMFEEDLPSHQRSTIVMPKAPLQEYPLSTDECVKDAFNKASFLGIRSLPNAMSPDFKARLYEELVEAGHRTGPGTGSRSVGGAAVEPKVSPSGPLAAPHTTGLKHVHKAHPYSGTFTTYEYMSSEYGRENAIARLEGLKSKISQVTPSEFVVKSVPAAVRGLPAFSEYPPSAEPYGRPDPGLIESRGAGPTVLSGAYVDMVEALRSRCDEAMAELCRQLSADWPASFLQIFEDKSGAIVMSFQRDRAILEGDLSAYMHQLAKTNPTVGAFRLRKDPAQWGLVDADSQCAFFLLWPPWTHHRPNNAPMPDSPTHPQGTPGASPTPL